MSENPTGRKWLCSYGMRQIFKKMANWQHLSSIRSLEPAYNPMLITYFASGKIEYVVCFIW